MDLHPKFIIVDDVLIISKVSYHKDILLKEVDPTNEHHRIKGGGWFRLNDKTMTFYGESQDFGKAKLEDIQKAVKEGDVFTNIYLTHSIVDKYDFNYDTGSELIPLKTLDNG